MARFKASYLYFFTLLALGELLFICGPGKSNRLDRRSSPLLRTEREQPEPRRSAQETKDEMPVGDKWGRPDLKSSPKSPNPPGQGSKPEKAPRDEETEGIPLNDETIHSDLKRAEENPIASPPPEGTEQEESGGEEPITSPPEDPEEAPEAIQPEEEDPVTSPPEEPKDDTEPTDPEDEEPPEESEEDTEPTDPEETPLEDSEAEPTSAGPSDEQSETFLEDLYTAVSETENFVPSGTSQIFTLPPGADAAPIDYATTEGSTCVTILLLSDQGVGIMQQPLEGEGDSADCALDTSRSTQDTIWREKERDGENENGPGLFSISSQVASCEPRAVIIGSRKKLAEGSRWLVKALGKKDFEVKYIEAPTDQKSPDSEDGAPGPQGKTAVRVTKDENGGVEMKVYYGENEPKYTLRWGKDGAVEKDFEKVDVRNFSEPGDLPGISPGDSPGGGPGSRGWGELLQPGMLRPKASSA